MDERSKSVVSLCTCRVSTLILSELGLARFNL